MMIPKQLHDLRVEATTAAGLRRLGSHPEVVALQVERIRTEVDACAWIAIGLGLAFTTVNVASFAADGAAAWSAAWLVAWLLDPMVSLLLIGVLRAEQVTARWQVAAGARMGTVKWACFGATYAMNTWASWSEGTARGVVLHSIPPAVVLLGAEVAPELRDRLTSVALIAAAQPTPEGHDAAEPTAVVASPDAVEERPAESASPGDALSAPPSADDVDPRVRELAELLADGCPVTGHQASVLNGCSTRTGRRLLADARALPVPRAHHRGPSSTALPELAPGPCLQLVHTREEPQL